MAKDFFQKKSAGKCLKCPLHTPKNKKNIECKVNKKIGYIKGDGRVLIILDMHRRDVEENLIKFFDKQFNNYSIAYGIKCSTKNFRRPIQ